MVTFGTVVGGTERAAVSADAVRDPAGIGRVAVHSAGLPVARPHRGAAVQGVRDPRGLLASVREQLSPFAAPGAQGDRGNGGGGRRVRVAKVDIVTGATRVLVRVVGVGNGRRTGDGVRRLQVVVMVVVVVVMVVVEHLGQRALLGVLEALVLEEKGESVAVLHAHLLGAAVAGGQTALHLLLLDGLEREPHHGATPGAAFVAALHARFPPPLALVIKCLIFTYTSARQAGRTLLGVDQIPYILFSGFEFELSAFGMC